MCENEQQCCARENYKLHAKLMTLEENNMIPIPKKPFYFLRHGETEWNRQHIYMGSQDIPLNETGRAQAFLAAKLLENQGIKHIVTSPLLRAKETAEIINKKINVDITIINELAECSWGEHEGKPVNDGTIAKQWLQGVSHLGAETAQDFVKRVINGLNLVLEFPDLTLIVAHGGVYAAIQRVMSWPLVNLKNCLPIFHKPPTDPNHHWRIYPLEEEFDI